MSDKLDLMPRPCHECPFRRDVDPGICATKNSHPGAFIGQTIGPFALPCHRQDEFKRDACSPDLLQCAGAASFRASLRDAGAEMSLPERIPVGPKDEVTFFGTQAEFVAHHLGLTAEEAEEAEGWLANYPPVLLLKMELEKRGVRVVWTKVKYNFGGEALTVNAVPASDASE